MRFTCRVIKKSLNMVVGPVLYLPTVVFVRGVLRRVRSVGVSRGEKEGGRV